MLGFVVECVIYKNDKLEEYIFSVEFFYIYWYFFVKFFYIIDKKVYVVGLRVSFVLLFDIVFFWDLIYIVVIKVIWYRFRRFL